MQLTWKGCNYLAKCWRTHTVTQLCKSREDDHPLLCKQDIHAILSIIIVPKRSSLPYLKRPSVHRVHLFNVQDNKVNLLTKMADQFAKFPQVRHKFWSGARAKVHHQGPARGLKVQQPSVWVFIIKAQQRDVNSRLTRARFLRDISPQNVQKSVLHFRAEHGVPKIIWMHSTLCPSQEQRLQHLFAKWNDIQEFSDNESKTKKACKEIKFTRKYVYARQHDSQMK